MEKAELRPGDIFCTSFPGTELGDIILQTEKKQSKDNQAELSHAGIIISNAGRTYEALWHYSHQNVWDRYGGDCKLIIGRHKFMTPLRFSVGYEFVFNKYNYGKYPWWRLVLHRFGLAKRISIGPAVCSELTMRFLVACGLKKEWRGWNPDDVADMIVRDRMFEIVYHKNITTYDKAYLDAGGET